MDFVDNQRQLLADQLRKYQAQAQTQAPEGRMVGRVYVAPNPLEYLAAGLRGYGGMKGEQQTQQAMGDLAEKRRAAMVEQLRGFGQAMQGTPEVPAADVADGPGQTFTAPAIPAKAGDPMAAYQMLLGGDSPELQKVGMQGIATTAAEQQKQAALLAGKERERIAKENERKRILEIITRNKDNPQQAILEGAPADLVKAVLESPNFGREEVKFEDVGGTKVPVTKYGTKPVGVAPLTKTAGPANPASDLLLPDPANPGQMIPNQPLIGVKGKLAQLGASKTNNTVINTGPVAFDKELAEMDAKQLGEWRNAALAGQSLKGTVEQLREAEKMGAYSGGGADTRLAVANMIEGWTGIAPKGLVGSQLYNAEANKLILDRVKALGANPSNADREFLQKTVPQLATSAEARKQMADWMERQAGAAIDRFQRADVYARQNKGLKGFDMFPLTAAPKPAGLPDASAIDAEIARRKAAKK